MSGSSVQKLHEGEITMRFETETQGGWTTWNIGEKTKTFQQWEIDFAIRNDSEASTLLHYPPGN